ncbi:hypothetical protein N801_09320 [Knoellia aerolata DSM 18566]|uniref:PASTA domain-containing protein n=1 Tax=Knoellia aerolata DSM 18566 TaxID=1385519 RepID=A0A0A0JV68_9MICO|nr:hypothetical protein N801_09320 [Knoellia aerolata DSM 18566]
MWPWVLVVVSAAIAAATAWFFLAGPGSPTVVPTVVGTPVAAAEASLRTQHLDPTREEAFSETIAKGLVVSTDPRPNAQVRRGTDVTVVVSQGPERHAVPTLSGVTLAEATDLITRANLVLGKITESFDDKVPEGRVISTSPEAGTSLKRDAVVALTVSKGRQPITVKDYTGKTLEVARAALGKAGLTVEVTAEQNDDKVPAGSIISQDPAEGTLFKGDKVSVVVSKGPVLVAVPGGLIGRQATAVRQTLEAAGFVVKIVQGGIPGINFGTVGKVDPGQGTMVPKGSTITLTTV